MRVSPGIVDLHSHLIPGVDDGAESVEDALRALEAMTSEGVSVAVTTPHLAAHLTRERGMLEERLGEVDEALAALRRGMADHGADLPELHRGHEVALDDPEPVFDDPRLRLAETDFVLVEWPFMKLPVVESAMEVLERIRSAGWTPVLAHPERYQGLDRRRDIVDAWRRTGTLLQVNHGSLLGVYGRTARENALYIVGRGMADLLSSDYHGWHGRDPGAVEVRRWFEGRGFDEVFRILAHENPRRILAGELPMPVPPLDDGGSSQGLLDRLKSRFLGG